MSRETPQTPTPASELCPSCRRPGIRRSASGLKHLARVLLRSPKRYCPACRKRWVVADRA